MSSLSDDDVRHLLKAALPVPGVGAPGGEMWPALIRTIDRAPHRPRWTDYALMAAVVLLCLFRPSVIAFLLLHL